MPSQIQNRHELLLSFRLRFPWLSKGVFSEFKKLDLVLLVMIFQHLEVFFILLSTQFPSSYNDLGVGQRIWSEVQIEGGKLGVFLIFCVLVSEQKSQRCLIAEI